MSGSKQWGKWKNLGQEDEGGQSHVFRVADTTGEFKGEYALKRLKNKKRLNRFGREIQIVNNINSPYIANVIDYDITSNENYFVTEFFLKKSLGKTSDQFWKGSFKSKISLCIEICLGVKTIHENKPIVIHRDLKPDNIFLRTGENSIVIGDFGLSFVEGEERFTVVDEAVGSKYYMHPDFANGMIEDVAPWHDLYSLGKIIYWIFSEGKIFDREEHRSPNSNLLSLSSLKDYDENLNYYTMVNNLLDKMITLDKNNRYELIDFVLSDLIKMKRVFEGKYHPLVEDGKHMCDFCGIGHYYNQGDYDIFNKGGMQIKNPDIRRTFICEFCGHVKTFYFGLGNQKQNWYKKNTN